MIKIGCTYAPKVTRVPITEYPNHFQVCEIGNTFYRFLAKKDILKLGKLPTKHKDFEFLLLINWFVSHKYQFRYANYREEAIKIMEKMKTMATELKCNKMLILTHWNTEYDDVFFKNVDDFFNSVDLSGYNLFWELRGLNWRDKFVRPKLEKKFTELNIGHSIDLLFGKPISFNQEGIVCTRLHGFGVRFNEYLHNLEDYRHLIQEINALLETNKMVYVIFCTSEMYNDAYFLKKLWDDIQARNADVETYQPTFKNDFELSYSFEGQNLVLKYTPPFAIAPEKDKIKISNKVMENMQGKIEEHVDLLNQVDNAKEIDNKLEYKYYSGLRKLGEYFVKYLMGDKVKVRYRMTDNNVIIVLNDQSSLNYPYELIFDNRNFLCIKNAVIRKFLEDGKEYPSEISALEGKQKAKILFINKDKDETVSQMVANFNPENAELNFVDGGGLKDIQAELVSGYDFITYLGNFHETEEIPSIKWGKSVIPLEEIFSGMKSPIKLFTLGSVTWQRKIIYLKDAYSQAIPAIKGGSNFLTNFVSLTREQLTEFFIEFYKMLLVGNDISSAVQKARERIFERTWGMNYSWLSFTLFGDEKFKVLGGR